MNYDIIVIGAGHAGCEAALVGAKLNKKILLVTINKKNIADMACNPSIGGSAKGIVVRELAALGGAMPKIADQTQIQIKMLNKSRGPAVQALRAQIDKIEYQNKMIKHLGKQTNITIIEDIVEELIIENKEVKGIKLNNSEKVFAQKVILTTGTYLKSSILIGSIRKDEGPHKEKNSKKLSDQLKKLGFEILRLKTGTPARILESSINKQDMEEENGDAENLYFSLIKKDYKRPSKPCYLTYTNETTHKIIIDNLSKSSMYGAIDDINSKGARYCPSVEDKIVRFSDKNRHQIFVEPESLESEEMYIQGLSTSMPREIQEEMIHSIKGLEKAVVTKYGYAIEYDAINPINIYKSLETKIIKNLYTAGQINGTSGYEEAAVQGFMAGLNASLSILGEEPLILKRNESYIGLLIDDLTTKGIIDPYRLLTSRAEHRLLLRTDNVEDRLIKYGEKYNLINKKEYKEYQKKEKNYQELLQLLETSYITPTKENLKILEIEINKGKINLYNLLKRPEITIQSLIDKKIINYNVDYELQNRIEIEIKYEGYIKKAKIDAEKLNNLERIKIPKEIDYYKMHNLASEAKQKLTEILPENLSQATRISGVNPSDISILMVELKKREIK